MCDCANDDDACGTVEFDDDIERIGVPPPAEVAIDDDDDDDDDERDRRKHNKPMMRPAQQHNTATPPTALPTINAMGNAVAVFATYGVDDDGVIRSDEEKKRKT